VASVKKALATVDGITDVELDSKTTTGKFSAPADLDVAATLNKFVEDGNKHIKDWSMVE
jgi:copper chaperone CopZ